MTSPSKPLKPRYKDLRHTSNLKEAIRIHESLNHLKTHQRFKWTNMGISLKWDESSGHITWHIAVWLWQQDQLTKKKSGVACHLFAFCPPNTWGKSPVTALPPAHVIVQPIPLTDDVKRIKPLGENMISDVWKWCGPTSDHPKVTKKSYFLSVYSYIYCHGTTATCKFLVSVTW